MKIGQTDMKNLTVAVRNFVKGPKKECVLNKKHSRVSQQKGNALRCIRFPSNVL